MKRRRWLIATLAALFVAQAPLCALACLAEDGGSDARGANAHLDAPCHDSAPNPSPAEPSRSHDDCGCDDSYAALLPSPDTVAPNLACGAALVPASVSQAMAARSRNAIPVSLAPTSLPPPDILLLKSTLVI